MQTLDEMTDAQISAMGPIEMMLRAYLRGNEDVALEAAQYADEIAARRNSRLKES
jgi:hypothetical protein